MSRKRKLEDSSTKSAKKRATLASWTTVEDFNITRCRRLNNVQLEPFKGPVLYWMSRDQRVQGELNIRDSNTMYTHTGDALQITGL